MTLNMKNYQGFNKKPYCSMHYPKTSFTIVTDTPENIRLKQQSMLNSLALYKDEFEKNKSKGFSVVSDTPEMQRAKKTQDLISNIKYHEEFEKSRVRSDAPLPENRQDYEQQPANPQYSNLPPNSQALSHQVGLVHTAMAAIPSHRGGQYQALYSYTAADADEVSLQEGDVILDGQKIDEGWMYGRLQRTGQQGMLPANYVQPL